MKIKDIAGSRPRFGYLRITALLRREGICVNKKTVYKLYKEERLELLKKKSNKFRKRTSLPRVALPRAKYAGERWSVDFIHDHLVRGQSFRIFSVIDQYSRKCLGLFVRKSFRGGEVIRCLERICIVLGYYPSSITSDNGPEFSSLDYENWAHKHKVWIDYIEPGKPTQNGLVESFHGKLRDECLKVNIFEGLEECQKIVTDWREDYNKFRPHSSLKNEVPDKIWKKSLEEFDKSMSLR